MCFLLAIPRRHCLHCHYVASLCPPSLFSVCCSQKHNTVSLLSSFFLGSFSSKCHFSKMFFSKLGPLIMAAKVLLPPKMAPDSVYGDYSVTPSSLISRSVLDMYKTCSNYCSSFHFFIACVSASLY